MKKIILLFLVLSVFGIKSQTPGYLIGASINVGTVTIKHFNTSTAAFTSLNTMPSVSGILQGENACDATNGIYYLYTSNGILKIDVPTGNVTNTLNVGTQVSGIEFNPNMGQLIGTKWNGASRDFVSINVSTGGITTIANLPGVSSIVSGETAFDITGNRYFLRTTGAIVIINGSTGAITSTVSNTTNFKGIEYNSNTSEIIGSYWNGSSEIFGSMNLTTGAISGTLVLTSVTSLAQGITAFDAAGNRYFNSTNLGITIINAGNGMIISSTGGGFSSYNNFEYIGNVNSCNFALSIPASVNATVGNNALINAASIPLGAILQWQSNPAGFGWMNVPNNAKYSGANNSALNVQSVSLQNHLQPFRLIAVLGSCTYTSNTSVIHLADTCILTGIQSNVGQVNTFNVYPNPSHNVITLDAEGSTDLNGYTLVILNTLGQQVSIQKLVSSSTQIDVSALKGVYFLELRDENNKISGVRKIIVD